MKQSIYILIAFATILFYSCQKDDPIVTAISLDKSEIEIYVGETYQFEVSHISSEAPTPKYKWEVADFIDYRPAGVAKVTDNGLLTALKEGETEVKVSTTEIGDANGQPFVATCRVKVKPVAAAGIKLNKTALTLKSGETEQLSYTISPENTTYKDVEWKSSDEKVATVSPLGVVKAIGVGEAVVTVNAKKDQAIKAVCNVKIEAMPLNGITLNKDNISAVAGDSIQLSITFDPVSTTNKNVKWSSSDTKVATVDEAGMVRILYPGSCEITAISEEGNYTAVCKVNVKEVSIEDIYFSNSSLEVIKGDKIQLELFFIPQNATNKGIIWSSSDTNVASVDQEGNITAINEGTTYINAQTKDNKMIATCRIVVINKVQANLKVEIRHSSYANIGGYVTANFTCILFNENERPITFTRLFVCDGSTDQVRVNYAPGWEIEAHSNIGLQGHYNGIYQPYYVVFFEYEGKEYYKEVGKE